MATTHVHRRLEDRLDAVERLADPARRGALIERFAALHLPTGAALEPLLGGVEGLDFPARSRAPLLAAAGGRSLPAFPAPASTAEALGMLYVLEGSTLGGRFILRALAERGVSDPRLAFLDPYGAQTGARWRGFLVVLARETEGCARHIADAVVGAQRAFAHAECVLCGEPA